jgi:hypothetical protein
MPPPDALLPVDADDARGTFSCRQTTRFSLACS